MRRKVTTSLLFFIAACATILVPRIYAEDPPCTDAGISEPCKAQPPQGWGAPTSMAASCGDASTLPANPTPRDIDAASNQCGKASILTKVTGVWSFQTGIGNATKLYEWPADKPKTQCLKYSFCTWDAINNVCVEYVGNLITPGGAGPWPKTVDEVYPVEKVCGKAKTE